VRVAYHESKLLWPDVHDCHPDILLSIGTGHNGEETHGLAEPDHYRDFRDRRREITSDIYVTPSPRGRTLGIGEWFRGTEIVQNLSIMVNRVDNILNSEQIWLDFKNDTAPSWREHHWPGWRYQRINPKLGYKPPRLDDKAELATMNRTVREKLRREQHYRKKVSRVAHQLVASSFYFEKANISKDENGYRSCQGIFV
jgi:hypothetical protein